MGDRRPSVMVTSGRKPASSEKDPGTPARSLVPLETDILQGCVEEARSLTALRLHPGHLECEI